MTIAHISGIPIEETIGPAGPALVMALGVAWARLRGRLRRRRRQASAARGIR